MKTEGRMAEDEIADLRRSAEATELALEWLIEALPDEARASLRARVRRDEVRLFGQGAEPDVDRPVLLRALELLAPGLEPQEGE